MRIKCIDCGTVYNLPEPKQGILLRCKKCGARFVLDTVRYLDDAVREDQIVSVGPNAAPLEQLARATSRSPAHTVPPAAARGDPQAPPHMPEARDATPWLWGFGLAWGYLTVGLFLPWIDLVLVKMNALNIIQYSFKSGKIELIMVALALLGHMMSLAGGWMVFCTWLSRRTGRVRTLPFAAASLGLLLLLLVNVYVGYARQGKLIFDVLAATFYINVAAAVAAFVCSLMLSRVGSGYRARPPVAWRGRY